MVLPVTFCQHFISPSSHLMTMTTGFMLVFSILSQFTIILIVTSARLHFRWLPSRKLITSSLVEYGIFTPPYYSIVLHCKTVNSTSDTWTCVWQRMAATHCINWRSALLNHSAESHVFERSSCSPCQSLAKVVTPFSQRHLTLTLVCSDETCMNVLLWFS